MAPTNRESKDALLGPRERQIAEAYARGASYREIAECLNIAPSTVRTHLGTIYRKLGVTSKIELLENLDGIDRGAGAKRDDSETIAELALNLEEALRRERVLGEVLAIISRSRGDVAKVIASVLDYALDLCDAEFGILFEFTAGAGFRAAHMRRIPEPFKNWLEAQGTFPVSPATSLGRVETGMTPVNIIDVRSEDIYRAGDPLRHATAELGGARSFVAIPVLAGTDLLGAFTIYRKELRPFDQRNLDLVQVFADQSAIAIENARLLSKTASHDIQQPTSRSPATEHSG